MTTQKVLELLNTYSKEELAFAVEQLFSHIYPGEYYTADEFELKGILQDLKEIMDVIHNNIHIIKRGEVDGTWDPNTETIN